MVTLLEIKAHFFLHSQAGKSMGSNLCATCLGLLNDTQIRPGKKNSVCTRSPRDVSPVCSRLPRNVQETSKSSVNSHMVFHSLKCNHFLFESEIRKAPWGVSTSKSSGLIPAFLMNEVLTMFTFPVIDYRFIVARGGIINVLFLFLWNVNSYIFIQDWNLDQQLQKRQKHLAAVSNVHPWCISRRRRDVINGKTHFFTHNGAPCGCVLFWPSRFLMDSSCLWKRADTVDDWLHLHRNRKSEELKSLRGIIG